MIVYEFIRCYHTMLSIYSSGSASAVILEHGEQHLPVTGCAQCERRTGGSSWCSRDPKSRTWIGLHQKAKSWIPMSLSNWVVLHLSLVPHRHEGCWPSFTNADHIGILRMALGKLCIAGMAFFRRFLAIIRRAGRCLDPHWNIGMRVLILHKRLDPQNLL